MNQLMNFTLSKPVKIARNKMKAFGKLVQQLSSTFCLLYTDDVFNPQKQERK